VGIVEELVEIWPNEVCDMEEEEIKKKKSGVREWTEEDNDEMGNMVDSYYEL